MSTIFVTGASGFIGASTCRALVARGHRVVGLVRGTGAEDLEAAGVRCVIGSLDQAESFEETLGECDGVVHLAANAAFGNGRHYRDQNVVTTQRLLEVVAKSAPRLLRFVYVSSIGAIDRAPSDDCRRPLSEESPPHPTSDYGRSKLEAEAFVRGSALPWVILRPAMVVGDGMRANSHFAVFAKLAIRQHPFARVGWPGALSVIHVSDLASAIVHVLEHETSLRRVFFAAGSPVRIADVLENAAPGVRRIGVAPIALAARLFPRVVPFKAKGLVLPALVADDCALRGTGWKPVHDGASALTEVVVRERRRAFAAMPPAGWTMVTGAASGLGRAISQRLAETGRRLLLVDRDAEGLAATAAELPRAEQIVVDLADESAVANLIVDARRRFDRIDELFACAGLGARGVFTALPYRRQADVVRVNLLARMQLVHALASGMRRRQFGRVVLISSSSAFQPMPTMAVYAASNAALLLFGEAIAAELREDGVEVSIICPGGMRTGFQAAAGVRVLQNEALATPESVAEQIVASIGQGKIVVTPSIRSKAMAMAARILPRRASLALWGRLMRELR